METVKRFQLNVLLALFLMLFSAVGAMAQQTISGTASDGSTGETLPGVNIQVKGTTTGTATAGDGQYELDVESLQDTLMFSFVGYQTRHVPINGRTEIDIEMQPQALQGQEMVVVGYGQVQRKDLTGSITRVNGKAFQNQSMTQITDMLSGTVPGLRTQQSASPAGGGSFEIRGQNSLTANTSPLIVVDGAIYSGSLRDINPSDIENIDVLKGASAAAIYGSRSANGVIEVTTKKGGEGGPIFNFSTKVGMSQPTKDRRPLGGDEYIKFRSDYFRETTRNDPTVPKDFYTNPNELPSDLSVNEWLNFNKNPNSDPYLEYLGRLKFFPGEREKALAGKTVDWYSKVINKSALRQNYDMSISGGTDKLSYYWSARYLNNKSVIVGDKYSAIQTRLNLDYKINKWLEIGTNTQYSNRNEGSTPASLALMYNVSPFSQVRNKDGALRIRPYGHQSTYNPLMNVYGHKRDKKINSIFSILYAELTFPLDIHYKFSFQPELSFTNDFNFWGDETITGTQTHAGGYGTRSSSKTSNWMIDNLLTWNKEIGVHSIKLTFLYNIEKKLNWYENITNENFSPNERLGFHGLQFGDSPNIDNSDTKQTGASLMGRLNYSLFNKYLFTASIRRDGYSAFGQKNPWATFPSFAVAWKLSDEKFYNTDWVINRIKLRASWGKNGNRDIGAYSALATISSSLAYNGANTEIGVHNSTLANPSLVWEKTTALNFGADIGILNNRINIHANYYIGTTKDLLVNRLLPIITGFSNVTTNVGKLRNHGFELELKSKNVSSAKFSWSSNLSFSFNRNKIISLYGDVGTYTLLGKTQGGELPDFTNEWFPGHSVDAIWNYNLTGVWQVDQAKEAAKYNMSPGDYRAEDVNKDGKYIDVQDKQFIGYTSPRYLIGLGNSFDFLGIFSASVFIKANLDYLIPFDQALRGSLSYDRRNFDLGHTPYWTAKNYNNTYARLRPVNTAFGGGVDFYEPGTFVRVQDVSLSYSFPPQSILLKRSNINKLSVFFSVHNLLTFDNYAGWDPESRMTPMPKTFTMGINLSL